MVTQKSLKAYMKGIVPIMDDANRSGKDIYKCLHCGHKWAEIGPFTCKCGSNNFRKIWNYSAATWELFKPIGNGMTRF